MPSLRYDGPYLVVDTHEAASTITLDIPNAPNIFPTFHTSHIKPFKQNDDDKYPQDPWNVLDLSS